MLTLQQWSSGGNKGHHMLAIIAIILMMLWITGMATSYTMGGLIHLLLVAAIAAASTLFM
ncbi:MAG TPA: lmo0937 family membrane protein [Dongiaceae bacterium]|jgi:hypothetical protein|nr:lmo0937 family membrane protein [Dongiaceae bacterium]